MDIACSSTTRPKVDACATFDTQSNHSHRLPSTRVGAKLLKFGKKCSSVLDRGRKQHSPSVKSKPEKQIVCPEVLGVAFSKRKTANAGAAKKTEKAKESSKVEEASSSATDIEPVITVENSSASVKEGSSEKIPPASTAKDVENIVPAETKEAVDHIPPKSEAQKEGLAPATTNENKKTEEDPPVPAAAKDTTDKVCSAPVLLLHDLVGKENKICSGASLQDLLQPLPESMRKQRRSKTSSHHSKFRVTVPVADDPLKLESAHSPKRAPVFNEQCPIEKCTKVTGRVKKKNSILRSIMDRVEDKRKKRASTKKNEVEPVVTSPFVRDDDDDETTITKKPFAKPLVFEKGNEAAYEVDDTDRAWKKQQAASFKHIPIPAKDPEYLQQTPLLKYVETQAMELRRKYIEKFKRKLQEGEQEMQNESEAALQFIEPKMNKSYLLRMQHRKKQPIMSGHFDQHFERFGRPPFSRGFNTTCNN